MSAENETSDIVDEPAAISTNKRWPHKAMHALSYRRFKVAPQEDGARLCLHKHTYTYTHTFFPLPFYPYILQYKSKVYDVTVM